VVIYPKLRQQLLMRMRREALAAHVNVIDEAFSCDAHFAAHAQGVDVPFCCTYEAMSTLLRMRMGLV
jgi:hypothetical protein